MASLSFVTSGSRDTINDIMEAVGLGRPYEKKCCPANAQNVTWQTPATHYGSMHMGSTPADELMLANMQEGILPDLLEGYEWGEGDLPDEQAALAAIGSGNMRYFAGGGWTPEEEEAERNAWLAASLEAAFGGGLQIIPDEPLD